MTALENLQTGLQVGSAEVSAFLRSEPDVYALTPGGEWTVRDTAVHLICGTRMYPKLLKDQPTRLRTEFDLSTLNAAFFLAMDEDRPRALADLTERAVTSFIDAIDGRKPDDPCQYGGFAVTVGVMAGGLCSEYLLHGFDMARAVGRQWSCPESAADSALAGIGSVYLSLLDPEKAGDLRASFAIEGQFGRFSCQVHNGTIEPFDSNADTDCTITGPSAQVLLWLSGRAGWADTTLSASGPRPDLAPSLADRLVHF
jgi:uncharacterized protein (TIGR03083 family)